MQRAVGSGRDADLEKQRINAMEHHIEIPHQQQQQQQTEQQKSPPMATRRWSRSKKTPPTTALLPVFLNSRPRHPLHSLTLHLIPLLIFLSFFLLWWFSNPVSLVVNDGRTTQVRPIERHRFLNKTDTVFDLGRLTILAVSTPPNPSVELTLTITDNKTVHALPPSGYTI